MLELTSIFIASHFTYEAMTSTFMGFLRIFTATQPKLSCFINNNKIDAFQNKIFTKYKKLTVSYLSYNWNAFQTIFMFGRNPEMQPL